MIPPDWREDETFDPFGEVPPVTDSDMPEGPREPRIALGPRYSTSDLRDPWDKEDWS